VVFAPIASVQISLCGRNRGWHAIRVVDHLLSACLGGISTFPGLPVALECLTLESRVRRPLEGSDENSFTVDTARHPEDNCTP